MHQRRERREVIVRHPHETLGLEQLAGRGRQHGLAGLDAARHRLPDSGERAMRAAAKEQELHAAGAAAEDEDLDLATHDGNHGAAG